MEEPIAAVQSMARRRMTTEAAAAATGKTIMRRSVHTFLKHYQFFTTTSALIALPFSASVLISIALIPRSSFSLLPAIYSRLHSFSKATDAFPPITSEFFVFVNLKLSQTICSFILTLPFSLTFLLIAKASVIQFFNSYKQPYSCHTSFSSLFDLYNRILYTHICNLFVLFSANATCLTLLFVAYNLLQGLNMLVPATAIDPPTNSWVAFCFASGCAVFYSLVLANALVICNLALVTSGMERRSRGFMAILKACVMIKGKASIGLALAVPVNLALAMLEALFQFRIGKNNYAAIDSEEGNNVSFAASEGLLIAYLYCTLLVLDVIMSCLFYESCKAAECCGVLDDEENKSRYFNLLEVEEGYCSGPHKLKVARMLYLYVH